MNNIEDTESPSNQPPVTLLTSTISGEKMKAIVSMSEAIRDLAKALNSTHVTLEMKNCNISNCETAVSIEAL